MNATKLLEVERGITIQARKVLDSVPMNEQWTIKQVCSELGRRGVRMDVDTVAGCLASLKDDGLVREGRRGEFQRTAPKVAVLAAVPVAPVAPVAPAAVAAPPVASAPVDPADTLARIASVAQSLRDAAKQLDDLAIEVEERIAVVGAESDKLRQLQQLLRSIGV
jgi:hypothetical protein